MMTRAAKLALADGTVFEGTAFGAEGEVYGEVVFNTSMTGYQEILTDPSYNGQIVTMTYPLIGNYGINSGDAESDRVALRGFIVRELCEEPSNYRSEQSLDEYLRAAGVIGLQGIDTRALVRRIRVHGAMTGVLSSTDLDDASLVRKAQESPELAGHDLVRDVMPDSSQEWAEPLSDFFHYPVTPPAWSGTAGEGDQPHVVAMDFGMKWNIPRHLRDMGCRSPSCRARPQPKTSLLTIRTESFCRTVPEIRGRWTTRSGRFRSWLSRSRSSGSVWAYSCWGWRWEARSSS